MTEEIQPSLIPSDDEVPKDDDARTVQELTERETNELIIALVGPVGSGVTTTGKEITEQLTSDYEYTVIPVGMSEIIFEASEFLKEKPPTDPSRIDRIRFLQKIGSALRKKFGKKYLANKSVEKMAIHRTTHGGVDKTGDINVPKPLRQAFIIGSLKHPSEIVRLQEVYGDRLWVFGIFAPQSVRVARLIEHGVKKEEADEIIKVDQEEGLDHGQKVRDTIQGSDFFIRNDGDNTKKLTRSIKRYLKILFNTEVVTPFPDETAMYNAAAAAAGSACLSRQVGAAIYSDVGELIGKGRNDVPKFGGGLYGYDDADDDNRCYKWRLKICHNDAQKDKLYLQIYDKLKDGQLLKRKDFDGVRSALASTDIKNIIEYSRSVHAEMDALLSVARGAKSGLVGGTLYCTTFPCHSCARHIVASGIETVIYVEPYPKSLAAILHSDSINSSKKDATQVSFLQYEGVAPKNMLRLFGSKKNRKKDGKAITINPLDATPISRSALDSFHQRELLVVKKLKETEKSI